jgi:menaquinone-dependent protoporphyrinogen oxidase
LRPSKAPCQPASMTDRVLVTVASKYGSTRDIADVVGRVLTEHGFDVDVSAVENVASVEDYDAIIAGSAVYAGQWMKQAREFVERHSSDLRDMPVWLFSSGPIGDPPKPQEDPVDIASVAELAGAREHRVFAGKLDRGKLSFGEKAIAMALRAPEGDFRDWDQIREWAAAIADAVAADDG